MSVSVTERLRGVASRALAPFPEFELEDVQVTGSGRARVVSVTLDKPGGVTVEDCAEASEAISRALDADDPVAGSYRLDVASLGLERPLTTPQQFARAVGSDVRVKVAQHEPIVGSLIAADASGITVAPLEGAEVTLAYTDVIRARTVLLDWDPATRAMNAGPDAGRESAPRARSKAAAGTNKRGKS